MNISLKTLTKTRLKYILSNRISKDLFPLDEDKYKKIMLENKQYFKIIYYQDKIIGVIGFMPTDKQYVLDGYLILTDNYKKCVLESLRVFKKLLSKFKSDIQFCKHHDDSRVNKWYSLFGFKLEDNYWVRRV